MASARSPEPTTAHRYPIPPPRHCIIWPSASSRAPAGSPTRTTTSAMMSKDGLAASARPCRRREDRAERRFRGGPDRDRGNHLSEVFAPFTGTQRTALGRRRVQALRRLRLSCARSGRSLSTGEPSQLCRPGHGPDHGGRRQADARRRWHALGQFLEFMSSMAST